MLAIPIVILLVMLVKPILTLNTGEDITLETKPVDPRDLLYGDYVYLEYEIQDVDKGDMDEDLLKKLDLQKNGQIPVYAVLKRDGTVHKLDQLRVKKPVDGVYLKGQLNFYGYWAGRKKSTVYNVDFNLDRYYVPENTGKSLEASARDGNLIAKVKVRNGYGILTNLNKK